MPGWVDRYAPPGKIWVCSACGKTSQDLYPTAEQMWDESCMRHAVLAMRGGCAKLGELYQPIGWQNQETLRGPK